MARNLAPGYCIVTRPGSLDFQARELFRDIRSPAASMFMQLNANNPWSRPGQMLIVAHPDTPAPLTFHAIKTLKQGKSKTVNALIGVNVE